MISFHYSFLLGHSTIDKIIEETSRVIWDKLCPVVMPSKISAEKWFEISEDFEKLWQTCQHAREQGLAVWKMPAFCLSPPGKFGTYLYDTSSNPNALGLGDFSLFDLLRWCDASQCYDIKDRIYALLALADNRDAFVIDYQEDILSVLANKRLLQGVEP